MSDLALTEVKCKGFWMDFAEIVDALRIFPRILIGYYGFWMAHVIYYTLHWYFDLKSDERTAQVTAVVGIIVPGIFGFGTLLYKLYSDGGRKWENSVTAQPYSSS